MRHLIILLGLLFLCTASAVSIQAAGSLPGGPATGVSVRADNGQVAVTTANRLGLFTAQGQRQVLLSPTGRWLVDTAYSGNDVYTLDIVGTLARVSGKQVKVVGQALCGELKENETPYLAVSGQTVAVSCPTFLLVGTPGKWQRVNLPALVDHYRTGQVALSQKADEVAVARAGKVLRFSLPGLKPLPTITRLPGEDITFMDNPLTPGSAAALSYDASSQRLAVGWGMSFARAYNQSVTVYDLKSGKGRSLPSYEDWTAHLAFSTNGKFLLADGTSTPRIWSLADWKLLPAPQPISTDIGVQGVAWMGRNIISASSLGALGLTPRGEQVASFPLPLSHVTLAALSENGRWVAVAGEGGRLSLYDLQTKRVAWSIKAHPQQVGSLKFNRAGTLLVSGDANSAFVRLWNVKTGKRIAPTITGSSNIAGFTRGDKAMVLGGRVVPVVSLLERQGQVVLSDLSGQTYHKASSETSQVSSDGKSVCETPSVLSSRGSGLRVSSWQLGALDKSNFGLSLPEYRRLATISADCRILAVAAVNVKEKPSTYNPLGIEAYDILSGKKLRLWPTGRSIASLAISPDGQRVAWLEEGRAELNLGDVKTGRKAVWKLSAVVQDMDSVPLIFRADGKALLVGVGSQPEMSFTVFSVP